MRLAAADALHHARGLSLSRPHRPGAQAQARTAASGGRGAPAADSGGGGVDEPTSEHRNGREFSAIFISSGVAQIEKLVPQPQLAVACGLLILNDWPIRSSTKSICEPAM